MNRGGVSAGHAKGCGALQDKAAGNPSLCRGRQNEARQMALYSDAALLRSNAGGDRGMIRNRESCNGELELPCSRVFDGKGEEPSDTELKRLPPV